MADGYGVQTHTMEAHVRVRVRGAQEGKCVRESISIKAFP